MKTAGTTRTLNPLPFLDLDPHRFEDLTRQLAYEWRRWRSLEAVGRLGADDGLDIRAFEAVDDGNEDDDSDDERQRSSSFRDRLWIFQCKREKSLAQKRIRQVVDDSLSSLTTAPYGFVLAVACDVSKKTRDAFREEMVQRGIEEFAIWAKGELEDMLFQPRNDRLLFAYFGISLTARRRTAATAIRSMIARKKQLAALLGGEDDQHGKLILLRDVADERYPKESEDGEPAGRWVAVHGLHLRDPGHLTVHHETYLAAIAPDGKSWDALLEHGVAHRGINAELRSQSAWAADDVSSTIEPDPYTFWNEYIDDADRAQLKEYRRVPLARIVAIDAEGDGFYPVPHVFVEFLPSTGPFAEGHWYSLQRTTNTWGRVEVRPEKANRRRIFPETLPMEHDPPLPAFDHATGTFSPLSETSEAKLREVLDAMDASRQPRAETSDRATHVQALDAALRQYLAWRDEVGRPVFSAFADRLRAKGHFAYVAVRSVERDGAREASESLSLRVQAHVGSTYNPSYRTSGHVTVTYSDHRRWALEQYPKPVEPGRGSGSPPSRAPSMPLSREQLEDEVGAMLERLRPER